MFKKNQTPVINLTQVIIKIPEVRAYKVVDDSVKQLLEFARVRIHLTPQTYKRVLDDMVTMGMVKTPGKYIAALIEAHFELLDLQRQSLAKIIALEHQLEANDVRIIPEERK